MGAKVGFPRNASKIANLTIHKPSKPKGKRRRCPSEITHSALLVRFRRMWIYGRRAPTLYEARECGNSSPHNWMHLRLNHHRRDWMGLLLCVPICRMFVGNCNEDEDSNNSIYVCSNNVRDWAIIVFLLFCVWKLIISVPVCSRNDGHMGEWIW